MVTPTAVRLTLFLLVSLVVANGVLWLSAKRLSANLAECMALAQPMLRPGVTLPALVGTDNRGLSRSVTLGTDGRQTLVLFYSPSCEYCDLNWPAWDRILLAVDSRAVQVVAIDPSGLTDDAFLRAHFMPEAVILAGVDYATGASYDLAVTPMTISIDARGILKGVWRGALTATTEAVINAAIRER